MIHTLLVACVLLSIFSCSRDDRWGDEDPDATGGAKIFLELVTPATFSPEPRSRALDFAAENTIDNIYVLVFNESNNLTNIKPGVDAVGGPDPAYNQGNLYSGVGTFSITLPPSMGAHTSKLVVLANAASILRATIGTDSTSRYMGRPYAEVIAAVQDSITGAMYTSGGRIPMWGETPQMAIVNGNNDQIVELIRAIARIDVGVGQISFNNTTKTYSWNGRDETGAIIPFQITSVCVARPNNRYAVVSDPANHSPSYAIAPTVPAGTAKFSLADSKSKFTFNAVGGAVTQNIYIPESDIRMNGLLSGDANHTNRMAIVVGGNYNGSSTTTYYRFDFAGSSGGLMNVLRDHLYQFNIAAISGPGFPTVDEAYNSLTTNITVNVLAWNQTNMGNIVIDGTNILSVSTDTVRLFGNEYNAPSPLRDNVVSVYTNVSTGWTLDRIVDNNNQPVTWATIDPTRNIQSVKGDVTIKVTQNTTNTARTAQIWFAAGRLRYRVIVIQSTEPASGMQIVNSANQPVQQLIFSAPAGTAPTPQSFTVNWIPATNPVTVMATQLGMFEFPNPGGNPAYQDNAPYHGQSVQPGNGTFTYTVTPPALTLQEIQTNPFIRKESRFDFSVYNGFTTLTRSIILTQISPALVVEPNPWVAPYFPMGGIYHYNVRSNVPWRISNITENPRIANTALIAPHTGLDNVYIGATGTPSYTPGSGYREQLTTNNNVRGNSGYADVTYSAATAGQFPDVIRRLYFPAAPFVIYGISSMPSGNANNWNYYSGNNGTPTGPAATNDIHTMAITAANYGTNLNPTPVTATSIPSSTVFVPPILVRGFQNNNASVVTTQHINDAIATNPDMLVISGSSTFGRDVADLIRDNFLQKNKPVLLCNEDVNTMVAMFQSLGAANLAPGSMYWNTGGGSNGNAPVYWFYNTDDPILNGPFMTSNGSPLRGNAYWGQDGNGSSPFWFTDASTIISYSNAENQSGSTDGTPTGLPSGSTMGNATTAWRYTRCPLIVVTDGGFLASYNQSATNQAPSRVNNTTKYPGYAGGYGGGSTKRDVYNAVFVANVTAWAIQRRTTQ
ncbi:MAG: hypothetical protein LBR65_06535 [Culturomica sp.]|nr:hypothetical protein [Culturomica sp.]